MINKLLESTRVEWLLRRASRDCASASRRMLQQLLSKSSSTCFGRAHGLHPEMDTEAFQSAVPIRSYVDYQPWIEAVINGEADVLWPGKPLALASTSGTTSDNKLIPITSDFLRDYHRGNLLTFHRMIHLPEALRGQVLTLGGPSQESHIGSLAVGSITGFLYSTFPTMISCRLALPPEVHNIISHEEKLYILARFALEAPVGGIITVIPGSLLVLNEALNSMAQELIGEIARGSMRELLTVPRSLEKQLRSRLRPNPRRAKRLRELHERDGGLIPKHIWRLQGICTYLKQGHPRQWNAIREAYGNVQMIDPGLVATEGRISVGLYPEKKHHAVLPVSSFVEFLPLDSAITQDGCQQTLLPHDLEKGRLYSPVISSSNGLLRYRVEDVVQVTSKPQPVPMIEYIGRLDDSLSAAGEKICDAHFREAISRLQQMGSVVDGLWAVGIDLEGPTPFYRFVWECDPTTTDFSSKLDQILQELNVSYRRKREQKLLDSLRATRVSQGDLVSSRENFRWLGQSKPQSLFDRQVPIPHE